MKIDVDDELWVCLKKAARDAELRGTELRVDVVEAPAGGVMTVQIAPAVRVKTKDYSGRLAAFTA